MNPEQRVVLLANDPQFAQMLRDATDVRLALSQPALSAPAFVAALFGDRVLSVFLLRERLFAAIDLLIQEHDPFAEATVRVMAVDYNLQPVALLRASGGPAPFPLLPARLHAGDRLVAIIALSDLERLLRRQPSSAGFAVEVTAFPLPARDWLASLVRTTAGLSAPQAQQALERLPLRLAGNLTRGQAEDMFAQLVRERITARVRAEDTT
jgi:hypothetical protein